MQKTYEWLLNQRISSPRVLIHVSVLDDSVHDVLSVVTAQLQQEPSLIIYVTISIFANHTLSYLIIVTDMCIEVSETDRGFVGHY